MAITMSKQENTQIPSSISIQSVPNCKIFASHGFALITMILFKFTHGLDSAFTTIIIPELHKMDAEIKISIDELTWFSSYCFMPPVGAILGGLLAQVIGCRQLLAISGILYISSGLIFHWSTNAAMLLCAQAIVGLVNGLQIGPCYTYLAEISLPQFRSFLMTSIGLCVMLGLFTSTVLGTYLYWRTLCLINITYPIIGLVLLFFLPESPYWLASKNRYGDAKRSLAWFRGWTTPDFVKDEMHSILSNSEKSSSSAVPTECLNSNIRRLDRLKEITKQYADRSFYIPFLTTIFVFVINDLNGNPIMNVFSILVFEKIDSPVDAHVAAILFSVSRVLGTMGCLIFINLIGKRKLLFITLAVTAVALSIAAAFSYLTHNNFLASAVYYWIPTISIIIAVFFASAGLDKIALLLNSEIFPLHLRYIGVGAGHFINAVLIALTNKSFLYLAEAITMSGTLLLFAIVNVVGLVGIFFIVPETEGKSLREIEEHFAGKKRLSREK